MYPFKTRLTQLSRLPQTCFNLLHHGYKQLFALICIYYRAAGPITLCFILSFSLTLGLGTSLTRSSKAIAQTSSPEQLVQTGVNAYETGDYQTAIDRWKDAIEVYAQDDASLERAIVQTNLAKAYRQLGQVEAALTALEDVESIYTPRSEMRAKLGLIKTEQAQILTSIGQYRRAIALICYVPTDAADANASRQSIAVPSTEVKLDSPEATIEYQLDSCDVAGAYPIAQSAEDAAGTVAALGSLAETYRLMGDYEKAIVLLNKGLTLTDENPSLADYKLPILDGLGNAYARKAKVFYQRAESSENLLDFKKSAADYRAEGDGYIDTAINQLNKALSLVQQQNDQTGLLGELRTQLNLLKIYRLIKFYRPERADDANANLTHTRQRLEQLLSLPQIPNSREKAYGAIALAGSYQTELAPLSCFIPGGAAQARKWLKQAQTISQTIDDARSLSFAIGQLGNIDKCEGNNAKALELTLEAEWKGDEGLASPDSLYLWQWQQGRIYEEQGNLQAALARYLEAIKTLTGIREEDILTTNQNLVAQGFQFDFRDAVEPLYRQAIELQLDLLNQPTQVVSNKQSTTSGPDKLTDEEAQCGASLSLRCALKTFDALRLAELQNYFGNDCALVPVKEEEVIDLVKTDTQSAVISSIIFEGRTAILLSIQTNDADNEQRSNLKLHWLDVERETLVDTINKYRRSLEDTTDLALAVNDVSQQIYDWMIQPFVTELENAEIETLVFVQDGILRSVPMAALWDGEQYLIEKFAIATVPSLNLTSPKRLDADNLQVLRFGLNEDWYENTATDRQYFPALTYVDDELDAIGNILPNSPPAQLNQDFTSDNIATALQTSKANILHLATHGQFSSDPENTFIALGNGEKLTFGQLERKIRRSSSNADPIELIALTACETGTGDDRSTLGLAGVAIRAGARSAIASLWLIEDKLTADLMKVFYEELKNPDSNKAQALQQAQIEAIKANGQNGHPGRWSPFILVGNWL